ncbi:transmembrane 220 family protein [Mucilaginibacter antarcticus]|uniref:Transmembrane 220 family protein n=1 Tax=Mucilaginibacter antarcticus TaxID=1855725 RepID=A0ABW5XSV9_9SPHI
MIVFIIINVIFCISFLGFAYLNFDDSDWYLWVPIYVAVAACCGLACFSMYYPNVYLGLTAFYLIYAVKLFFEKDGVKDWIVKYRTPSLVESMKAEKPFIENTREFFGLLIISGALVIDYFVVINL